MNRTELVQSIRQKKSYLCVGLDTDPAKIPAHLLSEPDPVFAFNKAIIDATLEFAVSYKINTAFYESQGIQGWESLQKTVAYLPSDVLSIADAKRGDIGNTSAQYAKTFFETFGFDAVTVAPYMGADSVEPFLAYKGKWTILLALTSNKGAADFELQKTGSEYLYEKVLKTAAGWGTPDNLMFVVGATQAERMASIRSVCPDHFYLVPGVGAQGGDLQALSQAALNKDVGLLVNVSRSIIYASSQADFAEKAGAAARAYQQEMMRFLL
ncbi:MAG: orotidine-5'-phosphate decarboxylase [Williamsia sp.]|nr:orotidine-5'-phosphate decarboxylase [Williamsia sp.]